MVVNAISTFPFLLFFIGKIADITVVDQTLTVTLKPDTKAAWRQAEHDMFELLAAMIPFKY